MRSSILITVAAATALLGGCASMNESECLVSDWQSVGYEDGAQGRTAGHIGNYRKACAKHGVSPDLSAYQEGRAQGLKEFCQPENGFDYGSRGGNYRGVCPADMSDEFLASYRQGRELYELEADVRSASRQLSSRRSRLEEIDQDILSSSAAIISDGSTAEERLSLMLRTKNLAEERGRVSAEIDRLVGEKAKLEEKLRAYREQTASTY
jgi:hypothetical protein